MKTIQVRDHGPYHQMLAPRRVRERTHRSLRKIDRDDADSRARHRERVATASCRNVERDDAPRHSRNHLDKKWLWRADRLAAMHVVPLRAFRLAHNTRASVKTSTDTAPAARITRAHSS